MIAVEYTVYDDSDNPETTFTWLSKDRFSLKGDGFPGVFYSPTIVKIKATVHFHDQRPTTLLVWE